MTNKLINGINLYKGIILIVDDNPTNLSVLSRALKDAGFKSRVAMDGVSALEQVKEDPPELILLDIQMPEMDGFETCNHLKANPATKDIPIIFITASVDLTNKIKGLSLGAVDYITKPFQHEEVIARVKIHLTLRFLMQKVQEQSLALQEANQELYKLANLDGLTEVANRRCFDEYIRREWKRHARQQEHISLILCDIDYFKPYNDHYGHLVGDDCLKQVAQAIKLILKRPTDLVARYGGEEFAIILGNTPLEGAIHIAELIQSHLKKLQIAHCQSKVSSYVSLSLGITSQIPIPKSSINSFINLADKALYIAKKEGRNRYATLLP